MRMNSLASVVSVWEVIFSIAQWEIYEFLNFFIPKYENAMRHTFRVQFAESIFFSSNFFQNFLKK